VRWAVEVDLVGVVADPARQFPVDRPGRHGPACRGGVARCFGDGAVVDVARNPHQRIRGERAEILEEQVRGAAELVDRSHDRVGGGGVQDIADGRKRLADAGHHDHRIGIVRDEGQAGGQRLVSGRFRPGVTGGEHLVAEHLQRVAIEHDDVVAPF
jgi:hypothetical protein